MKYYNLVCFDNYYVSINITVDATEENLNKLRKIAKRYSYKNTDESIGEEVWNRKTSKMEPRKEEVYYGDYRTNAIIKEITDPLVGFSDEATDYLLPKEEFCEKVYGNSYEETLKDFEDDGDLSWLDD